MFAISFELDINKTERHHPNGTRQAYIDIDEILYECGFKYQQCGFYLCQTDDLTNIFSAMTALKELPWLAKSVKSIHGFRIEHWSDFTPMVRNAPMSMNDVLNAPIKRKFD